MFTDIYFCQPKKNFKARSYTRLVVVTLSGADYIDAPFGFDVYAAARAHIYATIAKQIPGPVDLSVDGDYWLQIDNYVKNYDPRSDLSNCARITGTFVLRTAKPKDLDDEKVLGAAREVLAFVEQTFEKAYALARQSVVDHALVSTLHSETNALLAWIHDELRERAEVKTSYASRLAALNKEFEEAVKAECASVLDELPSAVSTSTHTYNQVSVAAALDIAREEFGPDALSIRASRNAHTLGVDLTRFTRVLAKVNKSA